MASRHQAPRGTQDVLPEESRRWQRVEAEFRDVCARYGYGEIRTPLFEETELFVRGVGEGTEIVSKQMYTFEDRGGRSLTLRAEGTAPVMRAYLERNLGAGGGVQKLYYAAPIFRYERPQAGRYRQHTQLGVEAIGAPGPEIDAEVIALFQDFAGAIGVEGAVTHLSSIGCPKCRPGFWADRRTGFLRGWQTLFLLRWMDYCLLLQTGKRPPPACVRQRWRSDQGAGTRGHRH